MRAGRRFHARPGRNDHPPLCLPNMGTLDRMRLFGKIALRRERAVDLIRRNMVEAEAFPCFGGSLDQ